jgi:hypothetical protein
MAMGLGGARPRGKAEKGGKIMRQYFSGLAVLMLLSACSGQSELSQSANNFAAPEQQANAHQAAQPAPPAILAPTKVGQIVHNDDALDFSYLWPAEAVSIAPLDSWLKGNADARYADVHMVALRDAAAMKADGFPFRKHALDQKWTTVADTPQVLVLQADGYAYTGGAHGMPFNSSIIWDKVREKRLSIGQFFDLPRFRNLVTGEFCDLLNKQRREKRGLEVKPDANDPFNGCPDILKQQILPISKRGKELDTVRVIIGPYEAGPYAEGTYTIEMQADGDLMRVVRRPYNAWFATP